ncbi:hypothetical protein G8A07_21375 [Roseateles sp. DAIF2]|uniref:hypothetical protein n=1 Tax=Roseateles sp. DAIF2 TaxID=2714952 RepID=UPI0018A3263C|nr:hypothetical protein [Roseateles sp. DAIF2]QPF75213.1 hypothetical protein G8A07_21375 [Roseateles sp. DAIF2]
MDRLAEQVVAWHNRNPLAKRISIYDVHTIGVVALPFMGGGAPAPLPAGPIEPVLGDTSDGEGAPEGPPLPPGPPPAIAASPPAAPLPAWRQALTPLLQRLGLAPRAGEGWPLFSERFINRLSSRRIAAFALRHGHANPPGAADWPQRAIPIDERLMARGAARAGGAWPYEIYLMSAGIDAGTSRTRVLLAQGDGEPLQVLGRRCLNPLALATLGALVLLLVGTPTLWLAGHHRGEAELAPPVAASAASAPLLVAAASAPPLPSAASEPSAPASSAASAPLEPASAASSSAVASVEVETPAATSSAPDIRPQLVPPRPIRPGTPPMAAATPASEPTAATGKTGTSTATPPAAATTLAEELNRPRATASAAPSIGDTAAATSGRQVALVGPVSPTRAEAEVVLERMRGLLGQTVSQPGALQGQVFRTHEGWRAAIWPFGSREEAQLINATLVARGLRTKAVDF